MKFIEDLNCLPFPVKTANISLDKVPKCAYITIGLKAIRQQITRQFVL